MDYEHAVISKAITDGDLKPLLDYKITPLHFEDGEHAQVYAWALEYWSNY
jgi:hypothetical protein